jgi:hypothetical protein
MPERPTEGDDILGGIDRDDDERQGNGLVGPDVGQLLGGEPGGDWQSDDDGRDLALGSGLTADERDLADELERERTRARARARLVATAGERAGGDDAGIDDDADAVIDAAGRFGDELDLSEEAIAERTAIQEALTDFALRPARDPDEFFFYGVIDKQTTNREGNIVLSVIVPWSHRHEVFHALETMPFQALFKMTKTEVAE